MKTFKLLAMTGALSASLCLFAAAVPNITKQPENVHGTTGGNIEFTCEAEGENVSYTWCWYNEATGKNNAFAETTSTGAPYIHGTKTNKLVIENMPAGYVGLKISCYVKDGADEAVWTDTALIEEGLKIIIQPSPRTAAVGDTVSLYCEANAEDAAYTWCWYNEAGKNWPMLKNTDTGSGFSLAGADSSVLCITNITEPYLGKTYACHISSASLGVSLWSNPVIIAKAEAAADTTEEEKKEEDVKPEDKKEEEQKEEDVKPEDKKEEEQKEEDVKPEDKKEEEQKEEDVKPEDKKEEEQKEEDVIPEVEEEAITEEIEEEYVYVDKDKIVYEGPDGEEHTVNAGEDAALTVSGRYLDATRYAYAWEFKPDGSENAAERNACTAGTLTLPFAQLEQYVDGTFICHIIDNADLEDKYITETFHLHHPVIVRTVKHTVIRFKDVSESDWYCESVRTACAAGLINGLTKTRFDPAGKLTYAQAVKLAACLHQLNADGEVTLTVSDSGAWYDSYTDYCVANGILVLQNEKGKLTAAFARQHANEPISREEYVSLFACALSGSSTLQDINDVAVSDIPDVASGSDYADAILRFYRAGIVVGRDAKGTFDPHADITRAEIAAILARVLKPEMRQTLPETFGK